MRTCLSFIACLCVFTGTPALAASPAAPRLAQIEALVRETMTKEHIPGLSLAVLDHGELVTTAGYGQADLENSVPATAATMYRLASVSKTITATAVMTLVEQGKLDLDAPIQRYVPSFPVKSAPITARQLLSHLSGIRHYRGDEIWSTRHYTSCTDGLAIFKDDPLLSDPGTAFHYSSYGYNLVGCVIEGASGRLYQDYVTEHVLRPIGLEHLLIDDVYTIIPHRAQGYTRSADGTLRNSGLADTSYKLGSGGWISTAEDIARLADAVASGRVVKPESVRQMWTVQKEGERHSGGYGLGWGVSEYKGVREISHSGGQQRVSTLLYLRPDSGVVMAILCNLEDAQLLELARSVADVVPAQDRAATH